MITAICVIIALYIPLLQWRTFAIQYSVVIDIVNIGIKILDTLKCFLVITRHFVFLNLRFCEYKSRER